MSIDVFERASKTDVESIAESRNEVTLGTWEWVVLQVPFKGGQIDRGDNFEG